MPDDAFPILPDTKVASMLDHYPQLEDVLIGLAPPFKKLKNPLLRKGVARVASLKQAAAAAGLPVSQLVNTLRAAVGQPAATLDDAAADAAYFTDQPKWFDRAKVVHTICESSVDPDRMPVAELLQRAMLLRNAEILELITAHLPAPAIDILKTKGYRVWSSQPDRNEIRTFVSRS